VGEDQKVMSKNPPDRWARVFGILGILIGLGGLGLTFYSNQKQEKVYQESLEERVLIRTMAWVTLNVSKQYKDHARTEPEGTLGVEAVNIGMRPLYLKSITAKIGPNSVVTFYEYDPLKANSALVKLEPGEAADYTAAVNFNVHHLMGSADEREDVWITLETTKKDFTQKARIDRINVSSYLFPLEARDFKPTKKKRAINKAAALR
jgi:hypothetical protein